MQRSKPTARKARIRQPLRGHGIGALAGRLPTGRYAIRFSREGAQTGGLPSTTARDQLLAASGCLEDGLGELESLLIRLGHRHGQNPPELHDALAHVVEALRLISTAYWQVDKTVSPRANGIVWPYKGRVTRLS